MGCPRGRGLVQNEEQGKNKKMKSIVVEEQEQEQEQEEGSETRFVDLDEDTLLNVLKRVDVVTLGRAACVNKLWHEVAQEDQLWKPMFLRYVARVGGLQYIDQYGPSVVRGMFRRRNLRRFLSDMAKPLPDFYSIDFSEEIKPWVQN